MVEEAERPAAVRPRWRVVRRPDAPATTVAAMSAPVEPEPERTAPMAEEAPRMERSLDSNPYLRGD
jgi:hypothetical protein